MRPEHFKNKNGDAHFRAAGLSRTFPKMALKSGLRADTGGVTGPIAIKPGDAPFDPLVIAGKAAILDDREMHGVNLAIAQHHVAAAITARNIARLPGPKGGLVNPAIGRDGERRIPVGALFFLELG